MVVLVREMGPLSSGKSRLVKFYFIWPDVWNIYLDEWLDFYGFHVDKYTSPIDPMGIESTFKALVTFLFLILPKYAKFHEPLGSFQWSNVQNLDDIPIYWLFKNGILITYNFNGLFVIPIKHYKTGYCFSSLNYSN